MLRLCALLIFATPALAEDVTVFAAASLRTALDAIAPGFEAATGHDLALSYAGSSALARQIQQGAPADVFLSASPDWMDVLQSDGLIDADSRTDLLGNRLVLIAHDPQAQPVEPSADLAALIGDDRLAMALVAAVPAGIYGKQALESLGLWDALAPQVVQTDNVRAALALVALGEAPSGIVYATDAAAEPSVTVIATFPPDSHAPITYPAAVTKDAGEAARAFLAHLRSPEAQAVFTAQGFTILP